MCEYSCCKTGYHSYLSASNRPLIVSSFPGVQHGPLYYRSLEHEKTTSLANHHGNYDAQVTLSADSISELHWWVNNVETATKRISHGEPRVFIQTDASTHGWGGVRDGIRTGGRWKPEEINSHINYLELLAILLTLKALCHDCQNKHIRVQCDNTTAVFYINNMGGSKSNNCNAITKHIWEFCIHQQIWLSAAHLPGCKNTDADLASRHFNDRTEWMLDRRIFEQVATKFGYPTIDLFASRLNNQCPNYASWRPDPGAQYVNAFSVNWHNFFFYAFPLFRENTTQSSRRDPDCTIMARSKLVSQATQTFGKPSSCDSSEAQLTQNASHSEVTPVTKETDVVSMSFMRRLYQNKGFSQQATNITLNSWRESSHHQYGTYISKWLLFCSKREINPVRPSITMAVEFLTELYDLGLGYSSISTARCALSAILECPSSSNSTFGQSVDVKRFMKGIFQSRPALPRYNKTWDVQTMLQYLSSMKDTKDRTLKDLSLKLVILDALTTAQSLHLMDTANMVHEQNSLVFMLGSAIKQTKPGIS